MMPCKFQKNVGNSVIQNNPTPLIPRTDIHVQVRKGQR